MTIEQLESSTKLKGKIEVLTNQKSYWEKAIGIKESPRLPMPGNNSDYVREQYINFDVLKALTLDNINKLLLDAEKELAAL